jgi:hypothetical protein
MRTFRSLTKWPLVSILAVLPSGNVTLSAAAVAGVAGGCTELEELEGAAVAGVACGCIELEELAGAAVAGVAGG